MALEIFWFMRARQTLAYPGEMWMRRQRNERKHVNVLP